MGAEDRNVLPDPAAMNPEPISLVFYNFGLAQAVFLSNNH